MFLDILYVVFLIFSATYLFTLFATSILMLYRVYKTRLYNLIFLGLVYMSAAISQIGNFIFNISLILEVVFHFLFESS